MNKNFLLVVQLLFSFGIILGSQGFSLDNFKWINVARFITYIIVGKYLPILCKLAYQRHTGNKVDYIALFKSTKVTAILCIASAAILVWFQEKLFTQEFVYVFIAYFIVDYFKMSGNRSISYGVGMACSYFEGYLVHVIPSDGVTIPGFEKNIRNLEDSQGVSFPVRRLFIIVTRSLHCPPDLVEFNKGDDFPRLDSFTSLEDVVKNVAGVAARQYRNTAYRIRRRGARPVSLAAECATPLHTLHRVLANHALYRELANIDVDEVRNEFCSTLQSILDKSPQCRGKVELVYYDDLDPTQNLAEILLNRISELEPNFEEKLIARMEDNVIGE